MPQNALFSTNSRSSGQPKNDEKTPFFFTTLHPLSTVIFATATVLTFVLLRDSRFSFYCYTQREATPTQKSARKCAATSRDFLHSAFTLANQLPNRPFPRARQEFGTSIAPCRLGRLAAVQQRRVHGHFTRRILIFRSKSMVEEKWIAGQEHKGRTCLL